ncbi:RAD55 family ATPase [Halohasta salina]|uniref:RAD55 family ATPase n=1 Tax=Halohasta salina TaxID=2961621 RepID=UPI0020A3D3DD|nr:HTR-like protein [Halohasta salina]
MEDIPFGISRLDSLLEGGAPPGSVVLLSGEAGAGAREFVYTSAAMNALAKTDSELFDLHYGEVPEGSRLPPEVHYISFTSAKSTLEQELRYTLSDDIVDAAIDNIRYQDLSVEYFQSSRIPQDWYLGRTTDLSDLSGGGNRQKVLSALGDYLTEHASGNLIVFDAITDLLSAIGDDLEWQDIPMLIRGLKRAAAQWGGLILVLASEETLTPTRRGQLSDAASGTIDFSWETGGSKRARVMVVKQFRGVLSRLEQEDIVQFESEIHEGGYDLSNVRKIR